MTPIDTSTHSTPVVNQVHVVGRVSHVGEVRELPSGDLVQLVRVVVPRTARRSSRARGNGVDVFDIACWSARSRKVAARLRVDEHVDVTGALRRRFFRAGTGASSRYEIEAVTLRRL